MSPFRHNYGFHVGDNPNQVRQRREALARACGRSIVWMDQYHSIEVALIDRSTPHARDDSLQYATVRADAVIIDARTWDDAPAAAVMVADCLPVLIATADGAVVAAVHAGRKGLLGGILTRVIDTVAHLGYPAQTLSAALGPAACGQCYEVPEYMRDEARVTHPAAASQTRRASAAIDLRAGAREELADLGVTLAVDDARCTIEDLALHSYRRNKVCGRQVGLIVPRSGAGITIA
ncbi:polyphenol oxidase family protein [Schaalia suimastitidis]|uniref:polyphenol oxidase family protein n=1 Tax=Schaalia suimastitidis TaxID=121163 RepID=UPI001F0B4667|nr:laccase domain-containing protein [Schaalia suimastitidis]